jgi:uncharacterized damage-inducible protein DinB
MHSQALFLKMFEYNHHINTRLLNLAANLTPDQWDAPQDIGRQSSLRETLFHILAVEEEWFYFCEQGTTRFGFRHLTSYPDMGSLCTFSEQNYPRMRMYLESLDETVLSSTVFGRPNTDQERTLTIWYILTHVLFHSAQHRSEVAIMLTRYGQSPSFIDFMGHDW